jgi:hypothetical protein
MAEQFTRDLAQSVEVTPMLLSNRGLYERGMTMLARLMRNLM